jgi:hypothetical protein
MRHITCISIALSFFLIAGSHAVAQTVLKGKVLSADGTPITKAQISAVIPGVQDIFAEREIRVAVEDDGSYQLRFDQLGIYTLRVRGVFHSTLNIPLLVFDQPEIVMNILMLPKVFNDGRYFNNRDYLEWIRVTGNFNDYDFHTGRQFSLNSDGSITAMVPVTSDTMRIQVRGLNYGQGASAIPPADKYELLPDNTFASVIYSSLPADSLEIHYVPGETIPYRRILPGSMRGNSPVISGFLTFRNESDRYWVEPLSTMQTHMVQFRVVEYSFSKGMPPLDQYAFQDSGPVSLFGMDWNPTLEEIADALENSSLHQQQVNLLLMAYAGVVHRAYMNRDYMRRFGASRDPEEVKYDPDILDRIPDEITPGHTIWSRNGLLPNFLLEHHQFSERWTTYFTELVRHHNSSDLAARLSQAIMEGTAEHYDSAEQMPVYRAIQDRFGEGRVLWRAAEIFDQVRNH